MLLGNILHYNTLCCIFKYNLALCLTYWKVINFKVLKTSWNNLRFINMSLSHPLFIWNLKHVVYGLYKQFPTSSLLLIPFSSFLILSKHCQRKTGKDRGGSFRISPDQHCQWNEQCLDMYVSRHGWWTLGTRKVQNVPGQTCTSPVMGNECREHARSRTSQDSSWEVRLGVHFIQNPRRVLRKEVTGNGGSEWDTKNRSSKKDKFKLQKGMKDKTRGNRLDWRE